MYPIRNFFAGLLLLAVVFPLRAQDGIPIGEWRDHFAYRLAISVAIGGGHVYCASENAIFRYHPPTGEITRITKVNALSDVGINGISWNQTMGMLLVYYSNGNLDLLKGDRVFNMGDIRRSNILGDKGIYSVHHEGDRAYLGCGFGVVVVDLARREVRETWFVGPAGSQVKVEDIVFHNDSIYVASQTGLFTASRNAGNLAAFSNWSKRTDIPATMVNGPFNAVASIGGKLLLNYRASAANADTLLVLGADDQFERFTPLYGRRNIRLNTTPDGTAIVIPHQGDIHRYDQDLVEQAFQYAYANNFCSPRDAWFDGVGVTWVADINLGLVRATGFDLGVAVVPNGPLNAGAYRMSSEDGALYVATGAVAGNWTNRFLKDGVNHFVDGQWRTSNPGNTPLLEEGANDFGGTVNDYMAVAVHPSDGNRAFAGTWDDGLIEFRDRVPVAIYNHTNSTLQEELNGPPGKVNVGGLSYDRQGNLWMTNGQSVASIAVLTSSGNWRSFTPGTILGGNFLVADILAARNGYKWVIRPRGSALLVFDDGGTIEDTNDDQYRLLNNVPGTGGLPSSDVYCLAEDLEGQIWVGTNRGPAVFFTPEAIFGDGNFDAQQILIEQDGNIQILLETEAISAIAVDGANRKWIGTETSGVFLISSDGREQIHHFTVTNSPLPSNTITSLAIDKINGEVFIGTDRGIISYRSDAVQGGFENECAKVFPNPVHETYTGPVAITGLVRDSEVRIADMAGNLVYRTTSLGGQAIWNATNMSGERVATGVYMVMVVDRFGSTKCNTKVLVIR
jgi:hypothetical protein